MCLWFLYAGRVATALATATARKTTPWIGKQDQDYAPDINPTKIQLMLTGHSTMTIQQNSQHQFLLAPRCDYIYKRKLKAPATGPYTPKTDQEVTEGLHELCANMGFKDVVTKNVKRMAGGASEEQFAFELSHADM